MGRYNPNIMGSAATVLLLSKDTYQFVPSEPKTFKRTSTDPKTKKEREIFGISYGLRVKGGQFDGKTIPLQFYMHTEGGFGMAKQFIMACMGYEVTQEGEAQFNADHADADFSFDPDTNEIGEYWKKPTGALVEADCDERANPNNLNQKNQTFKWRPVS